jgi:hypothetical protein
MQRRVLRPLQLSPLLWQRPIASVRLGVVIRYDCSRKCKVEAVRVEERSSMPLLNHVTSRPLAR